MSTEPKEKRVLNLISDKQYEGYEAIAVKKGLPKFADFWIRAVVALRKDKYEKDGKTMEGSKGMHSVFDKGNLAFRELYKGRGQMDVEPMDITNKLGDRNGTNGEKCMKVLHLKPEFKGVRIWLYGEAPKTDNSAAASDALAKMGL